MVHYQVILKKNKEKLDVEKIENYFMINIQLMLILLIISLII